ncbi:hypothetical protein [Actinomyces succiniciruminis]|uniref:Uncharacterized protein n=1 Tax=Actinomyces succiniciruminis TaxID=1522002 RepID=A0A1L7RCT5_9ACTO|nr:hypothetical protein [Actinomyces succiniciruminis]CED91767.1 Hypothetical protein AAM4_1935 [Actinomyces succiniciruminis]
MTDEEKQGAIEELRVLVQDSRAELGLEDGSSKAETLSQDLSDAWKSPKADDCEDLISEMVTEIYNDWYNLEGALET